MKTNSNSYTIIYSAIIVVIVAFLLAFVYQALSPKRTANESLDKKKQILYSLNIRGLDDQEAEQTYTKNLKSQQPFASDTIYTFVVDGQTKYVLPMKGTGLWGGISGFISLNDDKNTVYGAYFNHEGETAGLGAEIKDNQKWQEQFKGKKLFKDGDSNEISLSVVKGSKSSKGNYENTDPYQVDAVTGATLTSNGVSNMLHDNVKGLGQYLKFLNAK